MKNEKAKSGPKEVKKTFGSETLSQDFKDGESNIKVRVLIIVAVILAIALFFIIRNQTGVNRLKNMANKYITESNMEITDTKIIEAIEIEDEGYKTRLKDSCLKESYVIVEKDENGDIIITPKKVCSEDEPTIELNGAKTVTVEYGSEFVDPFATAILVDRDISDRIKVDKSKLNLSVLGSYTVTYTITDRNDNTADVKRTVKVVDTTSPIVNLKGESTITIVQGLYYNEPGYIASDNYDGVITDKVVVNGNVNNNIVGNYILTYTITDSSGNEASLTRTITVREPVAPKINVTLNSYLEASLTEGFDKTKGYTAFDERDGDITGKVVVTGTVDRTTLGDYKLTYSATASSGKTTTISKTITVKDTIAPATIDFGSLAFEKLRPDDIGDLKIYFLTGVTAEDSFDGDVTSSITVDYTSLYDEDNGVDNRYTKGEYDIIYTAEDLSGNKVTVTKTFTVKYKPATINGNVYKTLSNGFFELIAKSGYVIDLNGKLSLDNITLNGKLLTDVVLDLSYLECDSSTAEICNPDTILYNGKAYTLVVVAIETADEGNAIVYGFIDLEETELIMIGLYVDQEKIWILAVATVDESSFEDFEADDIILSGIDMAKLLQESTITVETEER